MKLDRRSRSVPILDLDCGVGVWRCIRVWANEDILVASGANSTAGACYSLVGPRLTIAFILILALDRDWRASSSFASSWLDLDGQAWRWYR